MREIAILALLLLPKSGFLSDIRGKASDYLRPKTSVVATEEALPSLLMPPSRRDTEVFGTTAKASYSIDLVTNTVLGQKDADTGLQIASLTKLMTAYVFLKENPDLDEFATISNYDLRAGDAIAGFSAGERYRKRDIFLGMMINSGSDAAQAIATLGEGTNDTFVLKMNQAAEELGLTKSHFTNPVGWDDERNYSSAKDIASLTRILLDNQVFRSTVGLRSATVYSGSGRAVTLLTTNQLLGRDGYTGVKTGYTYGAGECLASLQGADGHEILTVVIGSNDRFGETAATNTWTRQHFLW